MSRDKKKVIIVTRDFPPYSSITGWYIRMAALVNFLDDEGVEVHVVCLARAVRTEGYALRNGITVHGVKSIAHLYDVPLKDVNGAAKIFVMATKAVKRLAAKILPGQIDFEVHALGKLRSTVARIVDGDNCVVITSSPPHSVHLVGLELVQRNVANVRWIADFRDPWTKRPLYHSKHLVNHTVTEDKILRCADAVTVVSEGMKSSYDDVYQNKIRVVENGYLELEECAEQPQLADFIKEQHAQKRMVLGYFGTGGVGAGEASGKDLAFLARTFQKKPELFKKLALCLQGEINIAVPHDWDDRILVLDKTNPAQARANMAAVDLGLNVYTCREDADLTVGSKMYEFAAAGTPVWCLIPGGGISVKNFAKKVGGTIITEPNDSARMLEEVERMYMRWCSNGNPISRIEERELLAYRRTEQYLKMLELIHDIK